MTALVRAAITALLVGCSSEPAATSDENSTFPDAPISTATSDQGLHVDVRTAPSQPPPRGTCTVEFIVTDANGVPKDGLDFGVVPWMPAHGHGASTKPQIIPKGNGRYVALEVNFFMPGQWELRTTLSGDHAVPKLTVP